VLINKFEIGGSGGSNIYGSCRFIIYNLCALPYNTYDINRKIPILAKIVLQNFIWIGALWFDFVYTNLPEEVDISYNSYGMRTYTVKGLPSKGTLNELAIKNPWLTQNIADSFRMDNVSIQIPHITNITSTNIYRLKPLFYFNSFKILTNTLLACNIDSLADLIPTGNPAPLIVFNSSINIGFVSSEWLLSTVIFSAELYGQYLPICIQIENAEKVAFINSSITGQMVINASSLAISSTYLLALGTIDGKPLTENNPISKSIIYNCYNKKDGLDTRPGGVVAPSRFVLNCNEFISNTFKPLTDDLYSTPTEAVKYLPWSLENLENNPPPISKFSSSLYWNVSTLTEVPNKTEKVLKITAYDAILLTNYKTAQVAL
jgi:hypothetical protein